MQRLSGMLLMLAGAALGVYAYLPAQQDGAETLAQMTRISAAPDRDARSIGMANPSAANSPAGLAVAARSPGSAIDAAGKAKPAGNMVATVAATQPGGTAQGMALGTWSAVVTADTANAPKLSSSKPGDAETRAELTRDLQKELRRVGCYGGEITGAWTPSTRRAMSAFMDRVNATLPVDEPDYILLTLVQGHTAEACGVDCPAGQSLSGEGRCVPQAVIAQAHKKTQRDEQRRAAAERQTSDERQHANARQKTAMAKEQAIASAEPETLPWLNKHKAPAAEDVRVLKPRPNPLPGMMSIGGPEPLQLPSGAAALTPVPGPRPQLALADPAVDSDISPAAPQLKAPKPVPAERPQIAPVYKTSPAAGLPGTKSGAAARPQIGAVSNPSPAAGLPGSKSGVTVRRSKTVAPALAGFEPRPLSVGPRKITAVRRPPPMLPPVAVRMPKPKIKYYAANTKSRRNSPRPGSARYNLLQSLGGIY